MAPLGVMSSSAALLKDDRTHDSIEGLDSHGRKGLVEKDHGDVDVRKEAASQVRVSPRGMNERDSSSSSSQLRSQQGDASVNESRPVFDVNALLGYLRQAYEDGKGYRETPVEGLLTTVSTYQALFASRIFGMEYYQLSTFRSSLETQIASNLAETYLQSNKSRPYHGGFYLVRGAISPTIEGAFGAIATINLTGQTILFETQLIRDITPKFIFSRNHTISVNQSESLSFNSTTAMGFRDTWPETFPTIRATFEAVFILLTLNQTNLNSSQALQVLNFLKLKYDADTGLFNDGSQFTNPIVQTWFALRLIDWLLPLVNADSNLVTSPLTLDDILDVNQTILAIKNAQDLSSDPNPSNVTSMYGGFSFSPSQEPDVEQTGAALAVLSELGVPVTNENNGVINRTAALFFLNRSQFLDTQVPPPNNNLHGGFASNPRLANRTIAKDEFRPERVSMNNLFWVALGALVTGWLSESITLSIETSVYQKDKSYGMTNYLVQGEIATVNLRFMLRNSQYSHGELSITNVSIPTWDLDHDEIANPNAFPRNATYQFTILNDTDRNYNWSIGYHPLRVEYQVRSLNLIDSMSFNFTSNVFVGYRVTLVKFNASSTVPPIPATMSPNQTLLVEVHVENRSLFTYRSHNITTGNVSLVLVNPSGQIKVDQTYILNATSFRPLLNHTFANDSLLGTWYLQVRYDFNYTAIGLPSNLQMVINKSYEVNVETALQLLGFEVNDQLYPGSPLNMTVRLAYENGYISPKVNASLQFKFKGSTSTDPVFSVRLIHVNGTNFTVAETERVPQKLVMGSYELVVKFTWNTTRTTLTQELVNETLLKAEIEGHVVALQSSLVDGKQRYGILDNVTAEITIGVLLPNGSVIPVEPLLELPKNASSDAGNNQTTILKASDVLLAFLVNASNLDDVIDVFTMDIVDRSANQFNASLSLNPNLENNNYSIVFKVKLPTNETFVPIHDASVNATKRLNLTFTYDASFEASEFSLLSSAGNPLAGNEVNREEGFAIITFKVQSIGEPSFNVPDLTLYAVLKDAEGNNISVLAVAYLATSEQYQVVFSLLDLDSGQYSLEIYTVTAIHPDTKISAKAFTFSVFEEQQVAIEPIIQSSVIAILALLSIAVLYLNIRVKKRPST